MASPVFNTNRLFRATRDLNRPPYPAHACTALTEMDLCIQWSCLFGWALCGYYNEGHSDGYDYFSFIKSHHDIMKEFIRSDLVNMTHCPFCFKVMPKRNKVTIT